MSKYYKSIKENFIVKVMSENGATFSGSVVASQLLGVNVGDYGEYFLSKFFEIYTPTPQELIEWGETATLTNDNPNKVEVDDKDINLRLECLKLAVISYNTHAITRANEFYEWITQKTNQ